MRDPASFLDYLHRLYPDSGASLDFENDYQCLVAVLLSAQTTDVSVNKVTPSFFRDYPTPKELAKASIEDIESHIASLGLYHAKAKHLKELAIRLEKLDSTEINLSFDELTSLPGVGWKTASVFTMERKGGLSLPVDTHIKRISARLGYSKEGDEPEKVSLKLKKAFPQEEWSYLHHAMIDFGRNICHAQRPECSICEMKGQCLYLKKSSKTIGKKS